VRRFGGAHRPARARALREEIHAMRERCAPPTRCSRGMFDVKHSPGGMVDAEFAVQYLVLSQICRPPGWSDNLGNIALLQRAEACRPAARRRGPGRCQRAYRELRRVQHRARLEKIACIDQPWARVLYRPEGGGFDVAPLAHAAGVFWGGLLGLLGLLAARERRPGK
jgi:glutamine synthetase adenylyltransferase